MPTSRKDRGRNRYYLDLGADQDFKLSAGEWHELISGGWIERSEFKSAKLRRGIVGWVRGGDLYLLALKRVQTVTAGWLRAWLYKIGVIPAALVGCPLVDRQEAILFEQERERQNEALLWRTFRHTRGANEFVCISAETKAELIGALRPDLMQA